MATATFTTTVDASALASYSSGTETGLSNWNGAFRSNPVGVSNGAVYTYRSLVNIPIDFTTLTGATQITAATLNLKYFNGTGRQTVNTGSRRVNFHRLITAFTKGVGTDATNGWATSTTQNWNSRVKVAGTNYDSSVDGFLDLSGTQADKSSHSVDILPFILKIAPASLLVGVTTGVAGGAQTNNGLLMKMNSVSSASINGAEFYSQEGAVTYTSTAPTITITYTTNTKPAKPVPTSPLSLALQSGETVTFTSTHSDPDAGDLPSKFDLEISKNADWSLPIFTSQYTTTAAPLVATVQMNNFDSNINYYWRVRSYDTAGLASDWSDLATASFTAPTNTIGFPPPEGNPNFATTTTIARNKYRLEFYPLLASLNGFDPNPSAVIFDAKKIGISQEVNGGGQFFFTVKSDHPQLQFIVPQKTMWRACRWDEKNGYFRVLSEGMIVKSVTYPHETVFYGIDKVGMMERTMVSTEFTGADYSHIDVTLANLHDDIMARNAAVATITGAIGYPTATITGVTIPAPATITGISFPVAGTVRFAATNTFWVGQRVTMTNVVPSTYNLANVIITAVDAAWFEVASGLTAAWTSGGTATSGTIRFTANNTFAVADVVTITGVTPTVFNLIDEEIKAATATTFDVWDAVTGTYTSGGVATPSKSGIIRYTAANTFFTGQVVTITGITPSGFNLPLKTIIERDAAWFEIKDPFIGTYTSGGIATPAKTVMDMGWGESPTSFFRDYSVTNSGNATATTTKSIAVAGQQAATAISAMADVLMAGTTNRVILENPNIGLPAAAIDTMNVGLRYRHLTLTDIVKPGWWLQYGVNVKQYKLSDNLDQMSTRASVINRSNIGSSLTSSPYNGDTDADLYSQYLLIQRIEVTNEERNEIDYSAQFRYNTHPDRLWTLEVNIKPNWITPFDGYTVGDDLTVYIADHPVNIARDLTLVAQQWIANDNGAEYMAFAFSQRMEKEFLIRKETPLTPDPSGKTFPDLEPTSKAVDEGSTLDQMRGAPPRGIVGDEPQPDRNVEPPRIITPPQPTLPPEVTPPTPPFFPRKPTL